MQKQVKHFKVRINCPIWSSESRRLTFPHRWIAEHISITHQSPNYVSVQTPCGNLIFSLPQSERKLHYEFPRVLAYGEASPSTFSLSLCLCVCVCVYSMVMSKIFSSAHSPSVLHHLSWRLMCVFFLASLFPAIPHFPTLHSVHHSPATTWIETYLEYVAIFSLTNTPKSAKNMFWDNIVSVICCRIHGITQNNTFWMIFILQYVFYIHLTTRF